MIRYRVDVEWSGDFGYTTRSTWFYKESNARDLITRLCTEQREGATDVFNDCAGYARGEYMRIVGIFKVTEEQI